MMYKNSVKLLFSNFSLVWKTLLYNLIIIGIVGVLAYFSAVPVYDVLKLNGFFESVHDIFANFVENLNLRNFFKDIGACGKLFADIINNNFSDIWVSIVLFLLSIFVFGKLMFGLIKLPTQNVLYASMSNNMKVGTFTSFVANFKKVMLFELSKFVITFPIDILIAYAIILCFRLFKVGGTISILAPFIIVIIAIVLVAIRITMFSCWSPLIAVKDMGVFTSLKENFKLVLRRFIKIFGNSIGIVFTVIVINGMAILFTLGTCLFITIPLSSVLLHTYSMSAFYGSYGMRYYVDYSTIVEPKRMEATERLKNTKYHI